MRQKRDGKPQSAGQTVRRLMLLLHGNFQYISDIDRSVPYVLLGPDTRHSSFAYIRTD